MWTFEASGAGVSAGAGTGVTVHTEESWSGDPVDAAVDELTTALRTSLQSWLDSLKARAEQTA